MWNNREYRNGESETNTMFNLPREKRQTGTGSMQEMPRRLHAEVAIRARLCEAQRVAGGELSYDEAVRQFKKKYVLEAIKEERGNFLRAARRLEIHRNTVTRVMQEVGLNSKQVREYLRLNRCAQK
jgi:DNA-binding NtrC family response regulator